MVWFLEMTSNQYSHVWWIRQVIQLYNDILGKTMNDNYNYMKTYVFFEKKGEMKMIAQVYLFNSYALAYMICADLGICNYV